MNKITIATHNSKFHTDDVFAVAALTLLLEKDHEVEVIRTRDSEKISAAGYVVDVGFEYDPVRNRFDHHQKGGAGKRENGIPYASFGLVWKQYGEKLCGSKEIVERIDTLLIQQIDAGDNGMRIFDTRIKGMSPYDLHNIRSAFMPSWKEGLGNVDSIFMNTVLYAKTLLGREIKKHQDQLEAQEIIKKTYDASEDKRLVVFDGYYGASDYITNFPEPLFMAFPSHDGTWILETVQDNPESFIDRKSLPESWAGKSGEEFEKVTGVPGSIFCHNNRFLAVAATHEAILKLAEIALNS